MKKTLLSLLSLGFLLGIAAVGLAQSEAKPLAVVSFSGYEKLAAGLGAISPTDGAANAAHAPNAAQVFQMLAATMTPGIDAKRPWGAAVMIGEGSPPAGYGFLPVSDLDQLIAAAKAPLLGAGISIESNEGVHEIQFQGQSVFVQRKNDWAFVTKEKNLPADAPDPPKVLGELPKQYDLAVRLLMKNAPEEMRGQLSAMLRGAAELDLPRLPDESDENYFKRSQAKTYLVMAMSALVENSDDLLLGAGMNPETGVARFDAELTARSETELAERLAQLKPAATRYEGLAMPKAAVELNVIRSLSDQDVNAAKGALAVARFVAAMELQKRGLAESEMSPASKAIGEIFDALDKTLETKKVDAGLALKLDAGEAVAVAGGTIADAADLEKALIQLVETLRQGKADSLQSLQLNAKTHEGVRLHVLTIPTVGKKLAPLVGETLEVVVGFSDDQVWAAAGHDARKAIEQAIDRTKAAASDKEVNPLRISLAAGPIAKLVAQLADDEDAASKANDLAEALEKAEGKDHVTFTAIPTPRGVRLRLEAEDGLLRAIASIGSQIGPMRAAPMPMQFAPPKAVPRKN